MKKLISGLLVIVAGALFASQDFDARFVALTTWAGQLSDSAEKYNVICSQEPDKGDCGEIRAVLIEQYVMFVECANRYGTEDTDSAADLRRRIIKHMLKVAAFNIDCIGKATEQCRTEATALVKESASLKRELDAWTTKKL